LLQVRSAERQAKAQSADLSDVHWDDQSQSFVSGKELQRHTVKKKIERHVPAHL